MTVVVSLTSALTWGSLSLEAAAIPPKPREEMAVELPELPESARTEQDESAERHLTTAPEVPTTPYAPVAVEEWAPGVGTADLTEAEPGKSVPVENVPTVSLGVPEDGDPAGLAGEWTVDLKAPADSQTADVDGLLMEITPPATADPAAEVIVGVDYTAFADLYGPQAADRFGVVLLPNCVIDAPTEGECAPEPPAEETPDGAAVSMQPMASEIEVVHPKADAKLRAAAANEGETLQTRRVVSAGVPVAELLGVEAGSEASGLARASAADGPGSRAVGVLDTGASAAGDFTATPLQSSGAWASGSSSGAFTYGYQVQVPEAPGGLTPKVGLSYSSQSVDGRTSSTNNQASWIGDGWDYNAGSITRTYASCREDAKKTGANNATHKTGDMCWGSDNATLTLGGATTELVWDADDKQWFTANGDGSRIQVVMDTGKGNGDADGEYWIVTTNDGTKYHFGMNKLPGWSEGDPVTNSALTVPVFGNHADEPCYKAGDWKGSECKQAWRWNLDYVEDVHENAMSLWWKKDTNHYAKNFNWKAPVTYDRDGYLTHIDYGQRKNSIFGAEAPGRVLFTVAERCYAEGSLECSDANFTSKDPGKYRIWYDTPADLRCASGKMCWNAAPSFWSTKRLDTIQTSAQRRTGTDARQVVDRYQLKQSFPVLRTGPNTALWLESVTRTGYAQKGSTDASVTLNPVRFEPNVDDMPNRVMRGDQDPRPGFSRLRIGRVISEYGGETVVTYKQPAGQCATGQDLPGKSEKDALKSNTRLCYPSYWHPDPEKEDIDWFQKYVVQEIEELPNVDGAYSTSTKYTYGTAGWRMAEQEFTKKSTRTYSQFAGFDQVAVVTGADDPVIGSKRTKAVTRYFRGMGDNVSVKDTAGAHIAYDREPFAGRIAEELTYAEATVADAAWLTRSVTVPEATELASRDRGDSLDPLKAWRVTEPRQLAYSKDGDGDVRTSETKTTFETKYGLPVRIETLEDKADPGLVGDVSCTELEYVHHTGKNLIGLTKQSLSTATPCATADFTKTAKLASGSRTAYDGGGYGAALTDSTRGLATRTWSLKADGSGFQADGTVEFDSRGRVVKTTDPDDKSSTTTYRMEGGQTFGVTETNSLGQSSIQEIEPGRGTAPKSTDANGHVTQSVFDPLGRLVEAWAPGRTSSSSSVPDFAAEYHIPEIDPEEPDRLPPYVVTKARGHENRVESSVTVYDGLGRERQTQEEATGGGRLITDTLYNSSGEVWQTNNAYLATGKPSGQLFTPLAETAVPNATRYTYDGLGRVVKELPVLNGSEIQARSTRYEYGADWSTVINPSGAASYRVRTDSMGRTTQVDTFTDAERTEYTSVKYEFDDLGQLVKAYSAQNSARTWTWKYDQRGRMVSATDPDAGTTLTTYDHRDRPLTTTNARGVTVWTKYDELSRPTEQRLDGSAGDLVARSTYDTAPGGKGLPASSVRVTDGQEYTMTVGGYTADYQPRSTTLSLPDALATTWGLQKSYTSTYNYSDTGLLLDGTIPAAGAFDSEKLVVRYNEEGLPLSISGKDWYGSEAAYSPYGQLLRSTLGAQPHRVWSFSSFDDASGALTDQQVYREQNGDTAVVAGKLASHRSYSYDDAGNVTGIQERSTGIQERQCFTYDPIGQLTEAWTSADLDHCVDGPVKEDGALNVTAGPDGSGYWQQYEYDLLGNRKKLTEKDLAGATAKDSVTSYAYGKADGSQPHTLTKVTKKYTTPAGAQVTAEAERLHELTGETKQVTSLGNGDTQDLTWTWDGQVERLSGEGGGGRSPYVGLADKCLDLSGGTAAENTPVNLSGCNGSAAQKWSFREQPGQSDPDLGTMTVYDDKWCIEPGSPSAGSGLQLHACDGSANQKIKRNASGQLIHADTGLCIAVRDGATANGTSTVLATCSASSAAQKWEAQDETRYIYGPDGSRLLTVQGKQATLHVGETEVTTQAAGKLVSTHRSYDAPGGSVLRYQYGYNKTSTLVAQVGDHQGSTYAEVAMTDGMPVRVRKQDPFGNERGASTSGAGRQTHAAFLGMTPDDASGYTQLGARMYDPAVGRFLSADPVLDLADPMQANGYAYAHNNPVTLSDPTGLAVSLTASETAAALAGAGLSAAQVSQAQSTMGKSVTSVILSAAGEALWGLIGGGDVMGCFGGSVMSCVSMVVGAVPLGKLARIPSLVKAVHRTFNAIQALNKAKKKAEAVLAAAKAAQQKALAAKKAAIEKAKKAAQAAKKKAAEKKQTTSNKAVNETKKTGSPVQKQAQANSAPKVSSASATHKSSGGTKAGAGKPGGSSGGSSRSNGGSSGGGGSGKPGGSCPTSNSFVPGTKVVMADGSTKDIEDVEAGDKVLATDPETGETTVETVTAEIKGDGLKHLVKVTIDTDGDRGDETASVTATDGHPFWVEELGDWIDATDLRSGQWLRTSAGTHVQISAIQRWTAAGETVHNLTVSDTHTYYVLAGATPVLVHNCGSRPDGPDPDGNIVYRALAENDDPAMGLTARAPGNAGVSPLSHVAGKKLTPWISTTKNPGIAFDKYNQGHGVVAIDLRRTPYSYVDISSGPFPSSRRHSAYARKDSEVLIWQNIPAEAIVGHWPGG
ncbi:ricin-type beta-trefoil lectin domain protein [Streptomyces sp. JH34]|uniref:ricin-type beta-trefoil lectin domain protein n=1 Tax=Streptomyces sp. JH34 TaxID=2793633 RepID=UPI0023F8D518|nr:ricin-type beta-trefoil lectin domain protein [Streptomyces sp. JH34]MDF6019357.1 ricin-type beta-trefoil lectin domain protein [Streptomyces sp. JH34]